MDARSEEFNWQAFEREMKSEIAGKCSEYRDNVRTVQKALKNGATVEQIVEWRDNEVMEQYRADINSDIGGRVINSLSIVLAFGMQDDENLDETMMAACEIVLWNEVLFIMGSYDD